jgi:hypothetical protein
MKMGIHLALVIPVPLYFIPVPTFVRINSSGNPKKLTKGYKAPCPLGFVVERLD